MNHHEKHQSYHGDSWNVCIVVSPGISMNSLHEVFLVEGTISKNKNIRPLQACFTSSLVTVQNQSLEIHPNLEL